MDMVGGMGGMKGGWGGDFDGPYIGDANSGDQEDSWGGGYGQSWGGGKGKGGSQSWSGSSGRGRGGKDGKKGSYEDESWGGSWWNDDWNQESGSSGRGRGKGSKKGGDDWEEWESSGRGKGKKGDKGSGKDGKSGGSKWEPKEEGKRGKGGKKGASETAQWKPRENRDNGSAEADTGRKSKNDDSKDEVAMEIDAILSQAGANLEKDDFDFRVRRFLITLRNSGGKQKVKDALAMIQTYTAQKSRQSVKNWPAYLLTLLKKFEPEPFAKQKGKGRGNDRDQEKDETRQAPKAGGKKAVAPVAASAGAAAAPSGDDEVEVVRATEELPSSGTTDTQRPSLEVSLPPGWEDGRGAIYEEIRTALIGDGQPADGLRNPFTGERLDLESALVTNVVDCLRSSGSQAAGHHLVGFARSRSVVDCPRAAAAAAMVGGNSELAALPDNASAMDAVTACTAAGAASTAATVLQEIALELTAEVLRNPQVGPVTS